MSPASGTPGVVADRLVPTPGQVGAGAQVHAPRGGINARLDTSPPAEPHPELAYQRRNFKLAGSLVPILLTAAPMHQGAYEETPGHYVAMGGGGGQFTGAPKFGNVIEEHGPLQETRRGGLFGWWPFGRDRKDDDGRDERVLPAMGGPHVTGEPVPVYGAIARDNSFQIPDARRVNAAPTAPLWQGRAGYALTPEAMASAHFEVHSDQGDAVVLDYVSNEDERPRAGAAHPWQGRVARNPTTWWFRRPTFDQWAAHHTPGTKGVQGQPRVGLPLQTTREVATTGVAGYHVSTPAPGMEPLGISPNTWRITPQPWDQDLVTTGSTPSPVLSGQIGIERSAIQARRKSWKL